MKRLALAVLFTSGALQAQTVHLATAQVSIFPIPTPDSLTFAITSGADGNVWFLETAGHRVGRVTLSGVITEFPADSICCAEITSGSDGNLWLFGGPGLARISPTGAVSSFAIQTAGLGFPIDITSGPDGNLWITVTDHLPFPVIGVSSFLSIVRFNPSGATSTEFQLSRENANGGAITSGVNGDLWFTEYQDRHIGRITTSGVFTEFDTPGIGADSIAVASGGNVWFTEQGGLFKMTPQGAVTQVLATGSGAGGVIVGPDQKVWLTIFSKMAFVSSDGSITELILPTPASRIAAGPDGNIWFTGGAQSDAIGRLDVASVAPIANVPALSPLILILLALVLGASGVLALRQL